VRGGQRRALAYIGLSETPTPPTPLTPGNIFLVEIGLRAQNAI